MKQKIMHDMEDLKHWGTSKTDFFQEPIVLQRLFSFQLIIISHGSGSVVLYRCENVQIMTADPTSIHPLPNFLIQFSSIEVQKHFVTLCN